MLSFEDSVICKAPALQVWKLLYDPVRFSQWWSVVQRAEPTPDGAVCYTGEHADDAHPVHITTVRDGSRVLIRCLLTDDTYTWVLEPHPDGCRVSVRVEVAGDAAQRLQERRDDVLTSLPRLAGAAQQGDG